MPSFVRSRQAWLFCVLSSIVASNPALAHQAMGGETSFALHDWLISGFAHHVIDFDHLAFILGVGATSALLVAYFTTPLIFIGAMLKQVSASLH